MVSRWCGTNSVLPQAMGYSIIVIVCESLHLYINFNVRFFLYSQEHITMIQKIILNIFSSAVILMQFTVYHYNSQSHMHSV